MSYKALIDIGDYKKGDVVPDNIAVVWESMYEMPPVELIANTTKKVVELDVSSDKKDDYESELEGMKGLGKKTVKDILKVYPTKLSLVEAVNSDVDLPFRDDVVKKIEQRYKL